MNSLAPYDAITRCSKCEAKLNVSASWFGQELDCPKCEASFVFQLVTSGQTNDRATPRSTDPTGSESNDRPAQAAKQTRASATMPPRIGRYQAVSCLGQGGFGIVYLATDPVLQRDVAIKLPYLGRGKRGSESKLEARQRFHKEAQAAARLRHPNIVAVFDHGQTDEGDYIVYEFVPGETLEDAITSQRFDQHDAIELVATLADALSYAASEDIVHRDIKPANVMIDSHGRPQIMDFGLAVALQKGKARTGGRIAGTPAYMSPEQARGEQQIGPTADQYSLCAILYELLTGRRSVNNSGLAAVAEVANRESPPIEPLKSLPVDLRKIVLRAMQSDHAQRYEDCRDLAKDLRAYLGGYPVTANSLGWLGRTQKWASRNVATAVATASVAVLLFAVAVVSSFAAIQLQRRGTELASALLDAQAARVTAEEQTRIAKSQTAEAEKQREEAETQKHVADTQTEKALASQKEAEDALARELVERDRRQVAESLADSESQRRVEADAAADVAKTELQNVSEEKRSLQYSEWLTKADAEISRNDLLAARETLQLCARDDRGWEWHWLDQNAMVAREFRPAKQVPLGLRKRLQPPAMLSGRPGFQVYDAMQSGSQAPFDWHNPISFAIGRNGRTGALVRSIEIKSDLPAKRNSKKVFLRYLRKVDLTSGTFLDVRDQVARSPGVHLLGNGDYVSVLVTEPDSKNETKLMFSEVWSLSAESLKVLRVQVDDGWVPSYAIEESSNSLFGAISANEVKTWNLNNGRERHTATLDFSLAPGPQAMSLLPDGRLALIDQERRVHHVDWKSGEVTSGDNWGRAIGKYDYPFWDSSGRYFAFARPGELTVDKVPEGQIQAMPHRVWHVIDAAESRLHCSLSMPMSIASETVVRRKIDNGSVNVLVIAASALPILQLEVDAGGALIAVRDSNGGLWCWQREGDVGTVEQDLAFPGTLALSVRDGSLIAGTDGTSLVSMPLDKPNPRPQKLFRRSGGDVLELAVDDLSQRIAALDIDGVVVVFEQGKELWRQRITGATGAVFAAKGDKLFVTTERGDLITLDSQQNGKEVHREAAHRSAIKAVASLSNLRMIATVGVDRSIRFWDVITGLRVDIPETQVSEPVTKLLYDSTRKRLLVFTQTHIELFQCSASDAVRFGSAVLPHRVTQAGMFDDGNRIMATGDRNCSILDAHSGRVVYSLPQTEVDVSAVYSQHGDPWILHIDGVARHLRIQSRP